VHAYQDDVEEVVIGQRAQDLFDSSLCDQNPQTFHTAADVQQNDHVLRVGGRLNIPAAMRRNTSLHTDTHTIVLHTSMPLRHFKPINTNQCYIADEIVFKTKFVNV